MKDPLSVEQIRKRIERIEPVPFKGIVYRTTSPRYATEPDVLSGIGAAKVGGRWNPKGVAAVYCSVAPETALAETFAMQRYYGWPIQQALPRVLMALDVVLHRVLDLSDGSVRRRLQISATRMLETDWRLANANHHIPLTHLLGKAVFESGLEGIRTASSASKIGTNVVIFPANLIAASRLQVLNLDNAN